MVVSAGAPGRVVLDVEIVQSEHSQIVGWFVYTDAECRVEHSKSQIQMKDHDVADASSLMP